MKKTAQNAGSYLASLEQPGNNFWLIVGCLLCFVISGWSSFSALVLDYLKSSLDSLITTAIVSTAFTLFGLALFNILVTMIANKVNKNYASKIEKLDSKKMGELPIEHLESRYLLGCSYCGEPGKHLVCGSCDSILWYKIDGWTSKAAFFAAHRRNLTNGLLLSAFLVTPLTFLYQLMDKKIEAYNFYEQKSLEAREALNRARGLLVSLENLDLAYQAEPSMLLQKRIELMEEFRLAYTKTSWMAPQVIGYFGWDYRGGDDVSILIQKATQFTGNISLGSHNKSSTQKQDSVFDLDKTWKLMNTKWVNTKGDKLDFFKMLDEDFQNYVKASDNYYYAAFGNTSDTTNLDALKEEKCNAAKIFYKKGQLGGCLLFHISFDNNRTDVSKNKYLDFFGCSCYFDDFIAVWNDTIMSRERIGQFQQKIIEKVDSTGLFKCQYIHTALQRISTPPNSKPFAKKHAPARYEVIAGHFKSSQWADLRMNEIKALGYRPSRQWDESKAMYKVIALKTNESLKAYTAKHILEKEHGIQAFVIDRKRLQHSPENAFASYNH